MSKGGNSQPSQQQVTSTQYNFPPEIVPYLQDVLNQGERLANQPYVPYGGQQIANQSPMTLSSYGLANTFGAGGQNAFQGAIGNLGTASNTAAALQGFHPGQVTAPSLNNYQMAGVAPITSGSWTDPGTAQSFMNPFINQALNSQIAIANQQFGQQMNQMHSQEVQQGAWGVDRAALANAQAQNNFNQQINSMVGQGLSNAYSQGLQGFLGQNSQNLLAQEATQQGNLSTQNANLQALLGTQSLGSQLGLQAQTTNVANQLAGVQQQLSAAGLGGNLASLQQNYGANALNALYAAGQSAQNYQQQGLTAQYNNFINQQQYPEQQLNFLSGLIHGFNVSPNSYVSNVQTPSNPISKLLGAGLGLSGLNQLMGSPNSGSGTGAMG